MNRDKNGRFCRRTKTKIEFLPCFGKAALEYEATTMKEAVESAVKEGANLEGANIACAYLAGANLEGANLEGAYLRYANLEGANLEGANLEGAYLRYANLEGANLEGANIACAYLRYANLVKANLEGANIACAYLAGANLEGAYLRYANLEGAYLRYANLVKANLYGANLEGAKQGDNRLLWKIRPILQLGPCGRDGGRETVVFFYADGGEPSISCGCFSGNIDEFEAKIHETHNGTFHEVEYMAMVQYIKTIRKYQEMNNETH